MAHDHHHCECQHERVKFCAKCKVVHCLDCKFEWNEACRLSHSWQWPYYSLGGVSSFTVQNGVEQHSPPGTWTVTSTCEH